MNRAAFYIQGYVKMRWLSDLFQRLRFSVVIIQRHVRAWLAYRRALKEKYERY
jgi:myosin-5